ncbi:MAG: DUF308 domain-containing protein [Eubacteriales bacterium]|nr:DUF308 domain-containing protein [Eubacteriales bacterium]
MKTVRTAKIGYIVISALFCLAGALLIAFPGTSVTALCSAMGVLLLIYGVVKVVGFFSKDLYRLAFQFDLALGLLSAAVGLILLLHPVAILSMVHFIVGILILADGLFKIQIALDARRFGLTQWWLIFAGAILAGVFGLLLIIKPFQGAEVIMVRTGISLLAEGLLNLFVAVYAVKILKQGQNEVVVTEFCEKEDKPQ